MIQKGTRLNVIDNSGAKTIGCLHIVGGYKKRYAFIGDKIVASVKEMRSFGKKGRNKKQLKLKIKKGDVVSAVVTRTRFLSSVTTGLNFKFLKNEAFLINLKTKKLMGTRLVGFIPSSFRKTRYLKALSLSVAFIGL